MRHDDWSEGEQKTEVDRLVDRAFWCQGLATEGALAGLRYGFENLALEPLIQLANLASRRVSEKAELTFRSSGADALART